MGTLPLFPAPPAPRPRPDQVASAQKPPTDFDQFTPGVVSEGARQRELRILGALEEPGTLEDVLQRSHRSSLPLLTQSATLADLRCLVDEGKLRQRIVYYRPPPGEEER